MDAAGNWAPKKLIRKKIKIILRSEVNEFGVLEKGGGGVPLLRFQNVKCVEETGIIFLAELILFFIFVMSFLILVFK